MAASPWSFLPAVVRAGSGQNVLGRPHLAACRLSAVSFEWLFPETIVFSMPKSICEIPRPDGPLTISINRAWGGGKSLLQFLSADRRSTF